MNLRVLVADDEEKIRHAISIYLKKEGFAVSEAVDGEEALSRFRSEPMDFIILDVMMPRLDGIKVCKEIRKVSTVPIIMLTAKNEEVDRILGLEIGADDYMGKPFSPRELVARIKATTRRASNGSASNQHVLTFDGMSIDLLNRDVFVLNEQVFLTPKEFDLLAILARSPKRVFSREQLLSVWGFDYHGDLRIVDTNINRLRDKLRVDGAPSFISTVRGRGYKFEVNVMGNE